MHYRRSGGTLRTGEARAAWAVRSTGSCRTWRLAGWVASGLLPCHAAEGRIGRGTKPPPQFGQTLPSSSSTHVAQNVHSKLQIRAAAEAGGKAALQCSQDGRSSSMVFTSVMRLTLIEAAAIRIAGRAATQPVSRADRVFLADQFGQMTLAWRAVRSHAPSRFVHTSV